MAKMLSVPEVAAILGVKEPTIRKWVQERKIAFVKIGAFVRFDPDYIETIRKEGLR